MHDEVWVAADLHLQRGAWAHLQLHGDSIFALQQITENCEQKKPMALILAGDVLDKKSNRADVVKEMLEYINRIIDAGVQVAFIQGQHDKDQPPWLSLVDRAIHMDRKVLDLGGTFFCGLDWRPSVEIKNVVKKIPKHVQVLIAHQSWVELVGGLFPAELSLKDVPSHVRLVVSGDMHKNEICRLHDVTLVSPGASCMQDITEPTHHYYAVLRAGQFHRWEPLHSRLVVDWELSDEKTVAKLISSVPDLLKEWQKLTAHLPDALKKILVRIKVNGESPSNLAKLVDAIRPFSYPVISQVLPGNKEEEVKTLTVGSVAKLSELLQVMLGRDVDPEVSKLAHRLLDKEVSTAVAIEDWLEDRGVLV